MSHYVTLRSPTIVLVRREQYNSPVYPVNLVLKRYYCQSLGFRLFKTFILVYFFKEFQSIIVYLFLFNIHLFLLIFIFCSSIFFSIKCYKQSVNPNIPRPRRNKEKYFINGNSQHFFTQAGLVTSYRLGRQILKIAS